MRTISAAFATRLAQGSGQRTRLAKIERNDGITKYWAIGSHKVNGTAALTDVAGNVYSGNIIERLDAIQFRGDGSVSSSGFRAPLGTNGVSETEFILALYRGAKVTITSRYTDGTEGEVTLFVSWIGPIMRDGYVVRFEIRCRMAQMQGTIAAEMSPTCRAQFGSSVWPFRCTIDLDDYTYTGTVATIISKNAITATLSGDPDPLSFQFGELTWDANTKNAGTSAMVHGHSGSTLRLSEIPILPDVGDTFTVTTGCNKTITMCRLYDNANNFQGEDQLPALNQNVF